MKLKKLVSVAMADMMTVSLATCGESSTAETTAAAVTTATEAETTAVVEGAKTEIAEVSVTGGIAKEDLKIGFIYIGDENEGCTAVRYNGAIEMEEALGLFNDQIITKWSIPEDKTAKDVTMNLVDQGRQIAFTDSFGHEFYVIGAAKEHLDVQFCHATGFQAASNGLNDMHNYFTSTYEACYVSGVVTGPRLNQMIEDDTVKQDTYKTGYVGAHPYAETASGHTSFFLGVCFVCPNATMEAKYISSWASFGLEKEAINTLISDGCILINQHVDTTGTPAACEAAGVPYMGCNISMIVTVPNQALTPASNNWGTYVAEAVQHIIDEIEILVDWYKGFLGGTVLITELNEAAVAPETKERVGEAEAKLASGKLHVFDTPTWTVGGETLDTCKKDGSDVEYTSDGYFHRPEFGSAPSFDILIDGITAIDN